MVNGLSQHGGGSGAVAGGVVGLGGDFAHELGAHVFELVFKFDFLGHGYAVLGDDGRAVGFFNEHIAAFGAESNLHGVGQLVHANGHTVTSFGIEQNFFGGHGIISSNSYD